MNSRILLVDDDAALVDSLRDILEDAGYAVSAASNCRDALAELQHSDVELMLLDYNLPDGKGLDWVDQFQERKPGLKILLMTGMSERDLPLKGEVQGVIPKPIAPPELLQRIAEAILL